MDSRHIRGRSGQVGAAHARRCDLAPPPCRWCCPTHPHPHGLKALGQCAFIRHAPRTAPQSPVPPPPPPCRACAHAAMSALIFCTPLPPPTN